MRENNKISDSCLQCYAHHRQQLVAHLTRLGGCRALAEDLAQDAWLKLAQVMPEQRLDNPKAYLAPCSVHQTKLRSNSSKPCRPTPALWLKTTARCNACYASSMTCRRVAARCSNWPG